MKRLFDLMAGVCAALVLLLPIVLVALAVRLTSKGPALYWSDRVGRNNKIFKMPKFRSMRVGTPAVATHLANLAHPLEKVKRADSPSEGGVVFSQKDPLGHFELPLPRTQSQHTVPPVLPNQPSVPHH